MILLMMGRRAFVQMSIREDAEGDIDAAAYALEYADADADDAADADDTFVMKYHQNQQQKLAFKSVTILAHFQSPPI